MLKDYDITIGLEIHAELNTKTKIFCGCANSFSNEANTNCCPVCLGFPDTQPKLNKLAVEKTIMAGLAMNCEIIDHAVFERKHYFYPDLGKGYQVSQLEKPICIGGGIKLKSGKFIRLNRIHLEEDAGKLIHNYVTGETLVDCNRGGVPLNEIVTEPEISSAEEAVEFLEEVRARLIFAGVADCKMEEGGMRCDVNLSLKPKGSKTLGSRTEMKNLNSFKMVIRAIEFESQRQAEILDNGGKIITETRKWNDETGKTSSMRSKEEATDYRYFPDPDLPAVKITKEDVARIKEKMPILAYQLKEKFISEFNLPEYDAEILTRTKYISDYYLTCVKLLNEPKKISNWIMVDLLKLIKEQETDTFPVSPEDLTYIIRMTESGQITKVAGIKLLKQVIETGKTPAILAKETGLLTEITEDEILKLLMQLKEENKKICEDYKTSKEKVFPFIIGHVMRNTKGRAKSEIVEKLIFKVFE